MKKIWLFMAVVAIVMTAWLAAQLYLYDDIASQESDVCIWVSLARQLLDFGLVRGDLLTYYNRSIVDLLEALPVVAIFGLSTQVALLTFAVPYAVAFAAAGHVVAWRREDGAWRFDTTLFLLFNLLAGSLFHYNTGHALTFACASIAYGVFSQEDRVRTRIKWVVLAVVSFLGYVNDDFFVLMSILPVVGLNLLQWLFCRRLNLLSVPMLIGAGAGAALLKVLRTLQVVDYPRLELSLYSFDKMFEMLLETIKAYASNFMVLGLTAMPLKPAVMLQLAAYGAIAGLSVLAVAYAAWRVLSSRLDSRYDLDIVLLLAFCAVTGVYVFVASPTKPVNEMVPRYVYYGMVLMLMLLVRWWRSILPTGRLRVLALTLSVVLIVFSVRTNVVDKRANAHARDRLVEVSERMRAEGIGIAYCEWWTAKALEAAAKGSIRVYPLAPTPHEFAPMDMYCLRRIYGEACHAVVLPNYRAHYPVAVAEATIRNRIGAPSRELVSNGFKVLVYEKDLALRPRTD